jgi:hypothetical protein
MWEGDKLALRLKKNTLGQWEANESEMDQVMDPLADVPEFSASFMKLIRPAVRISIRISQQRRRHNIPDDVPTPPPSSSSDELFKPCKKVKKKVLKRRKK